MAKLTPGTKVKIHDPPWRDATDREYPAGRNHGRVGHIAEIADGRVGNDRLYHIVFGNGDWWPHWGQELRVEIG